MYDALRDYTLSVAALLLGAVLLAAPAGTLAQEASYAQHDYMKVPPGQSQAYVDLEQNLWKPIHRQRAEDGSIAGWNLYEVVSPAGADRSHDYVTVTFYEEWGQIENSLTTEHVDQAHPNKDPQQILDQTVETRSLVRSEVVEVIDAVTGEGSESENGDGGDYLRVDFMKVPEGGGSAYVQMEQELWKPIHRQLIEENAQGSWFLVGPQFTGTEDSYQYMTIHAGMSWSDTEPASQFQAIESAIQEVYPNRPLSEIGERAAETRTIVRTEIWRLVDSVDPSD